MIYLSDSASILAEAWLSAWLPSIMVSRGNTVNGGGRGRKVPDIHLSRPVQSIAFSTTLQTGRLKLVERAISSLQDNRQPWCGLAPAEGHLAA